MIALIAITVYAVEPNGTQYQLRAGQEVVIYHNQLQIDPRPMGPVQVLDRYGYNVVISVSGNTIHMKAKERRGYPCGPMIVKSGNEEFKFLIAGHHGKCDETGEHKH